MTRPLLLASASPRRAELLRQIGVPFRVKPVNVDESAYAEESAAHHVRRLAILKATTGHEAGCLTLAADTLVSLQGRTFGKPESEAEAVTMLMALGGRTHQVATGVCVTDGRRRQSRVVTTEVAFQPVDAALAQAYWRTGEPCDKAGGYGIQGVGGILVTRISGSYSAVVGLPLAEAEQLLLAFGFDTWSGRD